MSSAPRVVRLVFFAIAGWLALAAVRNAFFPELDVGPFFGRYVHDLVLVLAGGMCALLAGVVVGALAGTGWRLDRTWSLLGLGILTFWLADSLYLVHVANDTVVAPSWYDAGWWIGLTLVGAAAWQPVTTPDAEPPREGLRLIVMPLSFGVIGLATLIYASPAPRSRSGPASWRWPTPSTP